MPYLIVIFGQQWNPADTGQGGGAGGLNKKNATHGADAAACNIRKDMIVCDQVQHKTDH
jgi:hypothetical protein